MNDRLELRQAGSALRNELFGGDAATTHIDLDQLQRDVVFGKIWNRPGLSRSNRMIATLSALCVRQHGDVLQRYVGAALDTGLSAESINEIFIQCGIYAGFCTVSEAALERAAKVYAQRQITPPAPLDREDPLATLAQRGESLMDHLHASRKHDGHASPDNPVTAGFYPDVVAFCYGEIWQRPGLTVRQRAVCALASFTALAHAGLTGKFVATAMNVGLEHQEVVETIIQTGPYAGFAPVLQALVLVPPIGAKTAQR